MTITAINFAQAKELRHNSDTRTQAVKNLMGIEITKHILADSSGFYLNLFSWFTGLSLTEKEEVACSLEDSGFSVERLGKDFYLNLKTL